MRAIHFIAVLGAAVLLGCGDPVPPKPLTVNEVPAALAGAFPTNQPALRKQAAAAARGIKMRMLTNAAEQLAALTSNAALSEEQLSVAIRSLEAVRRGIKEQAEARQPGTPPPPLEWKSPAPQPPAE